MTSLLIIKAKRLWLMRAFYTTGQLSHPTRYQTPIRLLISRPFMVNFQRKIGELTHSIAYLEEDAPTRDEFDDLEKRIRLIENTTALN